ncbi:hypothetical protein GGF46_004460 [Coemansia sp. RSA 552]|nr:hypothetical protein GGF46_004460 [Coemansia sp. RSA 552]
MSLDEAVDSRLETLATQADQVRELVDKLRQRVEDGELATTQGLSFLEVKHQTMLAYISNLTYLALRKLHGQSIQDHPAVMELIEDRTVLEKMKPLEHRLKYQIDKLLRNAVVGASEKPSMATTDDPEKAPLADTGDKLAAMMLEENDATAADPSAFRPNPTSLAVDVREGDKEALESGVYRAPKQMPVHYEEDGDLATKRQRSEQRMMERAARSRLVKDLMVEYDDRPEMATSTGNASIGIKDSRMERLAVEKERFEEENFTRLAMGKKERKGMGKRLTGLEDEFSHLNDFAGLAALSKTSSQKESKAEVLERIRQRKREENMSTADKVNRRRRGGDKDDGSDDGFSAKAIHRTKRSKFQSAKRRTVKRK